MTKLRKQTRNNKAPARDDVGADSVGELARIRARIEELSHEKRLLEIRCSGLEAEIDDLKRERACLRAAASKREKEPRS